MEVKVIGFGPDGWAASSEETRKQIEEIKRLECALEHEGQKLEWLLFDNPAQPRTIFQFIEGDRKRRVDEDTLMADRPPTAVITVHGNRAVRLEFYEGHDALACTFDLRAKELQGKDLPLWMAIDPHAYDPVKFLEEAFGLPPEYTKPLLEEVHKELTEGGDQQ